MPTPPSTGKLAQRKPTPQSEPANKKSQKPQKSPRSSRSSSEESSSWVVEAWRQRGIICDAWVGSREQLAELHSNSWFARRNRNCGSSRSPHVASLVAQDLEQDVSWIARRNKHAGHAEQRPHRAVGESSPLEAWVRDKLPARETRPHPPQHAPPPRPGGARSAATAAGDGARSPRPLVELTLYDLCTCCNGAAHRLGVGVYHSGIVIEGLEYTYDNVALTSGCAPEETGVVSHAPYYTDAARQKVLPFRMRLILGTSRLDTRQSHKLLRGLASVWVSDDYDLLARNCHHWCLEAASALGVSAPPAWVTRASDILQFFSGLPSEKERRREQEHRKKKLGCGGSGGPGRSCSLQQMSPRSFSKKPHGESSRGGTSLVASSTEDEDEESTTENVPLLRPSTSHDSDVLHPDDEV